MRFKTWRGDQWVVGALRTEATGGSHGQAGCDRVFCSRHFLIVLENSVPPCPCETLGGWDFSPCPSASVFLWQEYLHAIHRLYEEWLLSGSLFPAAAPVLVSPCPSQSGDLRRRKARVTHATEKSSVSAPVSGQRLRGIWTNLRKGWLL